MQDVKIPTGTLEEKRGIQVETFATQLSGKAVSSTEAPLAPFLMYTCTRGELMRANEPHRKIMILEDDRPTRDLLAGILQSDSRDVFPASSIEEAKQVLQSNVPDLLLVDIYLPDGSGIKFLSELKEGSHSLRPFPPIIIMTAFGSWETHVRAYRLGAFYYLDKPFKVTQLRTLVERALAGV